jgi:hypothetical protein
MDLGQPKDSAASPKAAKTMTVSVTGLSAFASWSKKQSELRRLAKFYWGKTRVSTFRSLRGRSPSA